MRVVADEGVVQVTWDIVRRGLHLHVHQATTSSYLVTGGSASHWVNVGDPMVELCDCADHLSRARVCKHIVRVLIALEDPRMLRRVAELMLEESGG